MRPSLTTLCRGCAARLPADHAACPRCGGRALLDLRKEASRRRTAAALALPPAPTPVVRWLRGLARSSTNVAQFGPWVVVPCTFIALACAGGSSRLAFAFVVGMVATALLLMNSAALGLASMGTAIAAVIDVLTRRLRRNKPGHRIAWPVAPPRVTSSAARVRVRGRVRALTPFPSPLAHVPCVAFRLVGETEGSAIDDAELVPFDVVTEDGEVVHVPEGPATVALEVQDEPVSFQPDAALAHFLDQRAALVSQGPVRLAEAMLCDGAEVTVEGVESKRVVRLGYRDSREGRAIVERDGAPRVVRKAR